VEWIRGGEILPLAGAGSLDSLRAVRPWVIEEADDSLRMWYSGHDGTTWRILGAIRRKGEGWERMGLVIDAGFSGESDGYGVESPSVVKTSGGYVMSYAGFDGEATRLHMATSPDGLEWVPHGTIMQRGAEDALGASHPSLLVTSEQWWLFFSGYDGSSNGRRAVLLAAVSPSGASWDRVGTVLEPAEGEIATSHPCVLQISRTFYMFYGSDDGHRVSIALATSDDGVTWDRRGRTLTPMGEGPDGLSVHTPCVLKRSDGSLHMWYSGLRVGDTDLAYRLCFARFAGPQPI
jgi:predicted GH43/DUF377 family glycosyl hydrolase